MRKLTLVTAMLLLSSGAFAGGPRGLSMPQPAAQQPVVVQQPAVQPAAEQQRPVHRAEVTVLPGPAEQPAVTTPPSMEDKLKAAGELKPDGTPAQQSRTQIQQLQPQVQAPVQPAAVQPTPAPTRVSKAAPTPELVVTPEPARHVAQEPVRKRAALAYEPASRPVKKRVARRGESNERKARRIAAYFGVYW